MDLAGKTVVITGAGSGIGLAAADKFGQLGARLALCDISPKNCAELQARFRDAVVHQVDVASDEQMERFAAAVLATSVPTVLVNNAGVSVGGSFVETSMADWDWISSINIRGVVLGCKLFVPAMIEHGRGGQIVNLASVLGHFPAPLATAYVTSKFAVLGLSQSLRAELRPHKIGVSAVCPGLTKTAIIGGGRIHGEGRQQRLSQRFLRGADPSVVAEAIVASCRSNPAIRPTGIDGWSLYALSRTIPGLRNRLVGTIAMKLEQRKKL